MSPTETEVSIDSGTAYGKPAGSHDAELTEVGPGTPMGELMRRHWQPIALSENASDRPKAVRVLGEDLILFRSTDGKPGLVSERCTHRGSSLLYGRIDDHGIRCCYHGWAFDTEGRCTDQPCEPQNGLNRGKFRQPWYPVREQYGLVWAYMGPPEKKPLLPRYSTFEDLADDEHLVADDNNIGSGRNFSGPVPFNWLQHFENILDTGHFFWLHFFHSGPQFGSRYGEFDVLDYQPWEKLVGQEFVVTDTGVSAEQFTDLPDGRTLRTVTETILPGVRSVSNPLGAEGPTDLLGFVLPVDDTSMKIFSVYRGKKGEPTFLEQFSKIRPPGSEPDATHAQRFPGDWEAQGSQGSITLHSEEHLATGDSGIRILRRMLRDQMRIVAEGGDPANVAFVSGDEVIPVESGQFFD